MAANAQELKYVFVSLTDPFSSPPPSPKVAAHPLLSPPSPPPQVPDARLRRIRTRDGELRLAQKVTART